MGHRRHDYRAALSFWWKRTIEQPYGWAHLIRRLLYEEFAGGHWRRCDAKSTSLVRVMSPSRAAARRELCGVMAAGKDGAINWNQNLSNGGWSVGGKIEYMQGDQGIRKPSKEEGRGMDKRSGISSTKVITYWNQNRCHPQSPALRLAASWRMWTRWTTVT